MNLMSIHLISLILYQADHVGKAKQTFEMIGTAFYIIHWTRYLGLLLLVAALPLSYESLRRKIKKRSIYVDGTVNGINHETLKFWKQAKNLGSRLLGKFARFIFLYIVTLIGQN